MGYRGKVAEQEAARELRSHGWVLQDIATRLCVSKSSVSLWVRDVEFTPGPRRGARRRGPNALQLRKAAEIEALRVEGLTRLGCLDERAFLAAGAALYAGEGTKADGNVCFANSDARLIAFFCRWLRHFFEVDESRLTLRVYLHQGLDLEKAERYWSDVTGIPRSQLRKPYRAVADPTIRTVKHVNGCACVRYICSRTHRAIIGLIGALLTSELHSGVAQLAEHATVNRVVVGPSPTPGASEEDPKRQLSLLVL